jgi:CRP/FNR family transcriptional regulator
MAADAASNEHDHRFACVSLVPLFAHLSSDDRARIAEVAVTRHYERGEQIHRPGERSGLRIVHRGRVKVLRIGDSGAEQLLRIVSEGDFLGETTVFTDRPVDSWAMALDDAEVCTLGADGIDRLLRDHPEIALHLLATLSERLEQTERRLASITGSSVGRRLADHLLELADGSGSGRFRLQSTKSDLASYLGTTPETLSRRLGAMQDAGLIRLGPQGLVEVVDRDGLRNLEH